MPGLPQNQRFALLGRYKTPKFRIGQRVQWEVRGRVEIVELRDSRISWPWARGERGGKLSPVVYKDLAKAVRRDSNQAICYWWGLTSQTVTKWRKALGVATTNTGTLTLRRKHFAQPWADKARRKAWSKARDPERIAKIAASKIGKSRPPEVIEAMRRANVGKKHSLALRQKMSEIRKKLGIRPPKAGRSWSAEEDEWLRTLTTAEVRTKTGRTLTAIWSRRQLLGLPDGRSERHNKTR